MVRDQRHTEFGGGPGGPQRREDGSAKQLSVREQARIARQAGMRDLPSKTEPRRQQYFDPETGVEVDVPYGPDVRAIADLQAKTNRYSDDFNPGEQVSK